MSPSNDLGPLNLSATLPVDAVRRLSLVWRPILATSCFTLSPDYFYVEFGPFYLIKTNLTSILEYYFKF